MPRVYLDNAATSWPKPESVYVAIDRYQRELGVAAGRGSYRDAEEVDRLIGNARLATAKLINATSPHEIVFTQNCTDSLNLALHGLLKSGDHVITSAAEHNSILRPLWEFEKGGVEVSTVSVNPSGLLDVEEVRNATRDSTRLIAISHASNVTGTRQPIEPIAEFAKQQGILLLLDVAQTIGHEQINVQSFPVDLLAAPGHKGLLGPLGTGVLYISESIHDQLRATRQGGTGTESEQPRQPSASPAKYEAGNLNVPGIIGLAAGIQYLIDNECVSSDQLMQLSGQLIDGLTAFPDVSVYSQANRYGIVSFNLKGLDPRELATTLDSMAGIQVRAGLHCAPLMHRSIGTLEFGGTVRASFGHFSKSSEVATLLECIETLIANPMA